MNNESNPSNGINSSSSQFSETIHFSNSSISDISFSNFQLNDTFSEQMSLSAESIGLGELTRNTVSHSLPDRRISHLQSQDSQMLQRLPEPDSISDLSPSSNFEESKLEQRKYSGRPIPNNLRQFLLGLIRIERDFRVSGVTWNQRPRISPNEIDPNLIEIVQLVLHLDFHGAAEGDQDLDIIQVPTSKEFIQSLKIIELDETNCITEEGGKKDYPKCSICLEVTKLGEKGTTLPCGHLFHHACILEWLKQAHTCPICRHELPRSHDTI